jgi:multidrug efflux pump subunit AcrA (membrane-fusion protein)
MFIESDSYFPSYPRTRLIYNCCLALFACALASLPIIKIDIGIRTPALIRPSTEVHTVRNASGGRIKEWYLTENGRVTRDQPIYVVESVSTSGQASHLTDQIAELGRYIKDLKSALRASPDTSGMEWPHDIQTGFVTSYYRQGYSQFMQRLTEAKNRLLKARQNFDRQAKLFHQQVIAPAEFENYQYEFQAAKNNYGLVVETQFMDWENDLKIRSREKSDFESQLARLSAEQSVLTVKAPVSGTVQNVSDVYRGSFVSAGQDLGQISPDTTLLAIAYVSPNDIGLIELGMIVRLQINAFNYNQWGVVDGSVLEIPQDIKTYKDEPIFEVRCKLNRGFLELKSGSKGFLKKGMTSQAHFIVARRSLWNLLYDKVDDWINPARIRAFQ